jgi:small-conductance mechanosensitive channel
VVLVSSMALVLLPPVVMPLDLRRFIATTAVIALITSIAPAAAQESFLASLSPSAIDDLIASARPDAPVALKVANRTIATFRATVLGRSSADRAAAAQELIEAMTADGTRIAVTSRFLASASVVTVGGRDSFVILPQDVDALRSETVDGNTAAAVAALRQSIEEIAETRQPQVMLWALAQAVFATMAFALLLRLVHRSNRWATVAAGRSTERHLGRLSVGGEIVRSTRLVHYVGRSVAIAAFLATVSVGYLWLTFVLRRFPYTRPWGEALRAFLFDRVTLFGERIVGAVPDLFTVALIFIATRLLMRPINIVFAAIEEGRLEVMWIYPETAAPTRKLVIALLWLFALVTAYPYLPGAETDAFKGVSVFVGLMISLGSSGLVNQVMSGLTLTYSRALRRGDFVRIGDVEGTVTYMGTLSTKIETPTRAEVTIPNAVLVSQEVTNFTRNAARGVFVPTELTIGYDAPWRKVEALLLSAAGMTAGVRSDPAAFVLQKSLEDFYVRYVLLVCLDDTSKRGPILDDLHANIQDAFNAEGVQIMSPNYEADPGEPKIVPKERWYS